MSISTLQQVTSHLFRLDQPLQSLSTIVAYSPSGFDQNRSFHRKSTPCATPKNPYSCQTPPPPKVVTTNPFTLSSVPSQSFTTDSNRNAPPPVGAWGAAKLGVSKLSSDYKSNGTRPSFPERSSSCIGSAPPGVPSKAIEPMFPSTSYQTTRDGTGHNSRSKTPSAPLPKEPSFPESARGEKKQSKPASKKTPELAVDRTKDPHSAWNPFGSDSLPKSPTAGGSTKDTSSGTFWDQHG